MRRKTIWILLLLASSLKGTSQMYFTKNGFTGFYSKTSFEDIAAENNQVYAALDLSGRKLAFAMLLRGFQFKKELMQEHFNEDYVESDRFPKAEFQGNFTGPGNLTDPGSHLITVTGVLTLHGVSKQIHTEAEITVSPEKIVATSEFDLLPQDFHIKIPSVVRYKIASVIHVKVSAILKPR